jgi:hypothetical protein
MSKTKKDRAALEADNTAKIKNRYAEKVKTSAKIYSKEDRQENCSIVFACQSYRRDISI